MISVADKELAHDTDIRFHTNGTIWNQKYIDILHKFRSVRVGLSIDSDQPDQLSYMRHRLNVDVLMKNLVRYIKLSQQYPNIKIHITCTVSVFNIWYIDSIVHNLRKQGIQVNCHNVVYSPEHFDFRYLPQEIKHIIVEKIKPYPELAHLVSMLQHEIPGSDYHWPKFWQEVKLLDQIRNQNFADIFPEYYQALEPYLPK
jgi:sulfatase maturation enzyme AslB (radical SAM superfamily)